MSPATLYQRLSSVLPLKDILKQSKNLLNNGAELNSINFCKRTAFISAAFSGHLAVVQHLVQNGAELDAFDEVGKSDLFKAVLYKEWEVAFF